MGDHRFGKRIKAVRNYLDLSQNELAQAFGICGQTIVNWELGHSTPGIDDLKKMDSWGINPEYILFSSDAMFKTEVELVKVNIEEAAMKSQIAS